MVRYFKRKKGEILLVVMLLLDFTIGSPLPPPTSGPRIADKTTNHAGHSEEDTTVLSKPDDDLANNLLDQIEHIFEGAIQSTEENETEPLRAEDLQAEIDPLMGDSSQSSEEDENDLNRGKTSEEEDDEFNKEAEYVISQREQLVTDDLEMRTLQIMQDVDDYNNKVQNIGDVRETIRARCGQDVMSAVDDVLVNLGEDQDVMTVLTTVALLQLHQCPSAALNITSRLVIAVENRTTDDLNDFDSNMKEGLDTKVLITSAEQFDEIGKQPPGDQFPLLGTVDFCDHIEECKQTGIPLVRKELVHHPSLLALYDVSVAAVFTQTQNDAVANALIEDITGDLNITVAEGDLNITTHLRITKRSSCVDKDEAKAQSIISWIPFIGTIYNLISSAVYAGKGCKDVAQERAIEGAMDLAMDVGTVLTLGLGTAAFQGAKIAIKGAGKQAVKAAAKGALKQSLKKSVKDTVTGYLNPFKGLYREVKDAAKAVTSLVKGVSSLAKKGGKVLKEQVQKLTKSGAKQIDNVNPQAVGKSSNSKITSVQTADGPVRCKRDYGGCSVSKTDLADKVNEQFGSRGSQVARNNHAARLDDMWNKHKITDSLLPDNCKNCKGIDVRNSELTNKEIFQTLQEKAAENAPLYVKQNLGGVDVEYVARRQPYPNSKDQIVIQLRDAKGERQPSRYADMTAELDIFAQNTAMSKKTSELKTTFTETEMLLDEKKVNGAKAKVSELIERLKTMPKDTVDLAKKRQDIQAYKREAVKDIANAVKNNKVSFSEKIQNILNNLAKNLNIDPFKNAIGPGPQEKINNAFKKNLKGKQKIFKDAVADVTEQLDMMANKNAFEARKSELKEMIKNIRDVSSNAGQELQQQTERLTDMLNSFEDTFNQAVVNNHKEMATAMLQAIEHKPSPGVAGAFSRVFNEDSVAREAAGDFIVITELAEAVPGRIKGNDGYFRAGLRKMGDQGWTFTDFREKAGIVTGRRNLQHGKVFFKKAKNRDQQLDALRKTDSDLKMVEDVIDVMSDPGRRRRK